jgi:hypothetical protein
MRPPGGLVAAAATLCLVAGTASPAHAGDGFGWPPAKMDFGYLTFATEDGTYAGMQWLVGLNWATIYPRKTRFDIGIGYVGAAVQDPFAGERPQPTHPVKGVTVLPEERAPLLMHGGYLEMSTRIAAGSHWRTWFSARGELLSVDGKGSLGAAARVSTELWHGWLESDRGGILCGVLSLGLWVEGSARELGDRAVVAAASAGMSLRIPLLVIGK